MENITSVKVGPLTFKVLLVKDKSNSDFFTEEGVIKMYGECNYIHQTITINAHISEERMLAAIVHELTHAYLDTLYRGVLISRDDMLNEEEIAHFVGIYGSIIVSESKRIFVEIFNGKK